MADDEDICQILGLNLMPQKKHFNQQRCSVFFPPCPARKLQVILNTLDLKRWLGTAQVNVDVIRTVRPWKQWLLDIKSLFVHMFPLTCTPDPI